VINEKTQILILGSLPGHASLSAGQYYAHPRNQFWRLLGEIIEQPLSKLDYAERLECMLAGGVGLWDVVANATRQGSLDAALKQVVPNNLRDLIQKLPALRAIAFTGATAWRAHRQLTGLPVDLLQLPSSSPAFTLEYANKLAVWRDLRRYL
jgi:hypoxanthine-DNA glycosylase